MTLELVLAPLQANAFKPFGDVIETHDHPEIINYGQTEKFADLAQIEATAAGGNAALHLFRSQPVAFPIRIEFLERHPLGSQAFVPLHRNPFIVVVAEAGQPPEPNAVRGFITNGRQGVNFHHGVWHHYQLSLVEGCEYLVVDRAGPGSNFDEYRLGQPLVIKRLPA